MRLTDLPLDRPVATIMVLVCLTVLGTVAVGYLPLAFMPVVAEPEVDISVPYPGSHPLETLRQIVEPIEEEVASIPNVKSIYAGAGSGSASLEVLFDWGVDIELVKMEVREAVERARSKLPEGIGHIRVVGDTDGPGAEILGGRISANRDLSESWDLLDRRIRRPLERIRGVASVNLYGVDPQQVRIDLDLAALRQHGREVAEIVELINAANLDLDLGAVRGDLLRYDVRSEARFRDIETIRELELGVPGLRLKDVAAIDLREPTLTAGRHLNRKFAIGFDVYKEAGANTVQTVAEIQDRLDEIQNDPELQGITVLIWQDQAEAILGSLAGLRDAGLFGGLLALVVLFLFLRRLSTTLIVGVAIPFSLLVTCGGMFLLGMDFNVLSMLGLMLGVGMLVDNAVVVIENIYRLQSTGMPAVTAARIGSRQVALAVVASTATTIIVWSWLFVSEPDEMQIYIGQVATVICLAVTCSLVISLTFIPMAAARFIPDKPLAPGYVLRWLIPRYRGLLAWTLRHRASALFVLFLLAGSAAIPIALIEKSGQPRTQTRDTVITYRVHDPSTLEVLEGHVNRVEDLLEGHRNELGFTDLYSWFSEDDNHANTRVYLPQHAATEARFNRLKEQIQDLLPLIPGVELEIGDQQGRSRGPREGGSLRLALHGADPEFLEELAREAESRLGRMEHVKEVYGPSLVGDEEVRVRIDPERARNLGVSPREVAEAIGFIFRGRQLSRYQGQRGEVDVILGLHETLRPGLAALAEVPIPTADGAVLALGSVADVELSRTTQRINRFNRKTTQRVTLQFDDQATTTRAMHDQAEVVMNGLPLPDGYAWDWDDSHHQDDRALAVMLRGVVISLIVVVLLMAALFESFTQPLAILITLPLALFGAFWSLWLFGFEFEVLGFIGVIILIGVVVNNGIVMVDHVNTLRRDGQPREAALIEGCGDRLRPVLMTVITTVVGLTPLAMSQFVVAGVYIQSMAVAMIGGLASSTVFTLVALPVWYTAIEDSGALLAGLLPRPRGEGRARTPRGTMPIGDDPV